MKKSWLLLVTVFICSDPLTAQIWGPTYGVCSPASNNVGIGAGCPTATHSRLTVRADNLHRSIVALNLSNVGSSTGTSALEGAVIGTGTNMTIRTLDVGYAVNASCSATLGAAGSFEVSPSNGNITTAYGAQAIVKSSGSGSLGTGFGVSGEVQKGSLRYGVFGKAAMLQAVPILNWSTVTSWAGYFDGHVQVLGSFTSGSDRKLKRDIRPLEGATEILNQLQPKRYFFDRDAHPNMELPYDEQFGLIAQEVAEVAPNLVASSTHPAQYDADGSVKYEAEEYLAMNYMGLVPVLISGFKEQQATIEEQRALIGDLERRLAALEDNRTGVNSSSSKGEKEAYMEQNSPNPFNENTVIKYSLPGTEKGVIHIHDARGTRMQSFAVNGVGQLLLSAGSLGVGSYTYSLELDGVKVDSKTMLIIP